MRPPLALDRGSLRSFFLTAVTHLFPGCSKSMTGKLSEGLLNSEGYELRGCRRSSAPTRSPPHFRQGQKSRALNSTPKKNPVLLIYMGFPHFMDLECHFTHTHTHTSVWSNPGTSPLSPVLCGTRPRVPRAHTELPAVACLASSHYSNPALHMARVHCHD